MKQLFISTMLMLVMQLAYGQDNTDKLSRITKIVTNDQSTVTIDSDNGEASISYSQETGKPYRVKEGVLFIDGANEVRITTSNLSQLETNDASTAVVNGGLSNGFEVIGNDASSVAIYGSLNKVVVQSNDASSISLSGTCSSLNVVANDASTVQAGDMKAESDRKAKEAADYAAAKGKYGGLLNGKGTGRGNTGQAGNQGDPNGDPNAKNLEGIHTGGKGRIGGGLGNRGVISEPKITDNSQKTGVVMIKVCVNKTGSVISADYTQKGSTTNDATLINIAKRNAMKFKFTAGDVEQQCGTITYDFKVQ